MSESERMPERGRASENERAPESGRASGSGRMPESGIRSENRRRLEYQEFSYQVVNDGICILRCYGENGRVEIPEQLEGLPVTELSDYAFAEKMEQEPEYTGELTCICGELLEELYLPGTIRRLGRYVFYNCVRFRRLSFYSDIAYMGAGGFTGCGRLSQLVVHQTEGKSCLREILQDLKQAVTVACYPALEPSVLAQPEGAGRNSEGSGGNSEGSGRNSEGSGRNSEGSGRNSERGGSEAPLWRLVFPEFFEEAVENTPARIISTQTHGMGIQYRNTFRNTQIIFQEYDKLFEMGKYNIDFINILNMAVSRLMFPYCLESSAGGEYGGWLREHWKESAFCLLEQESRSELCWLAEEFAGTGEEVETLIQAANDKKDTQMVSKLMDISHKRFPKKVRRFSL